METFTAPRAFIKNPQYQEQRQASLRKLDLTAIDPPIIDIVREFSRLPYCFTLQSCYGHFLFPGNNDPNNVEPLPHEIGIESVDYRIAYLAFCIENSEFGRELFEDLDQIPSIDPEYIQFGSADWFWDIQCNTYALQVEPTRYMTRDSCRVNFREALHIEKVRDQFFEELRKLLRRRLGY